MKRAIGTLVVYSIMCFVTNVTYAKNQPITHALGFIEIPAPKSHWLLVTKDKELEGRHLDVLRVAEKGEATKKLDDKQTKNFKNEQQKKQKGMEKKKEEAKKVMEKGEGKGKALGNMKKEAHSLPDVCARPDPPGWCL